MPGQGEGEWGNWDAAARSQCGLLSLALTAVGRALAVESDRWFLWLPVFFAAGIIAYFALSNEPQPRVAAALVLGAIGICLALRSAPLGLALAGAFLAFASGFATAKLRTEITRAPVLAHELRYVGVSGWVEAHELRDKGRARLTIRVLSLGDLEPEERPYRVRVTMPAPDAANSRIGEAVALSATLQPPPEPIEPGGFDFGRQAWFASLGATGYATSKIQSLNDAGALPWDLRAWSGIDALRARVNAASGRHWRVRPARSPSRSSPARGEAFPGVEPGYARFGPRAHPFHFRPALYLEGLSIRAESVVVPDRVVLKRAPPPPAPGNDAADPISDWAAIQKNKDQ